MADQNEAYMLPRGEQETNRLDAQHRFWSVLVGHLIHPSIPLAVVKHVADVGTGTGVWLRQLASQMDSTPQSPSCTFVGFDISDEQFPSEREAKNMDFAVHDMTVPFPHKYWEAFDVVHVRLLTYALKANKLEDAVRNVVQLLKPGGYLQWEDADIVDTYVIPETEKFRTVLKVIEAERIERGLTSTITQPLIRTLSNLTNPESPPTQEHKHPDSKKINLLAWSTTPLLRIIDIRTHSTFNHPDPHTSNRVRDAIWSGCKALLHLSAQRKRKSAEGTEISDVQREGLLRQAREHEGLACDAFFESARWEMDCVSILARKAVFVGLSEGGWNRARHPELDLELEWPMDEKRSRTDGR